MITQEKIKILEQWADYHWQMFLYYRECKQNGSWDVIVMHKDYADAYARAVEITRGNKDYMDIPEAMSGYEQYKFGDTPPVLRKYL